MSLNNILDQKNDNTPKVLVVPKEYGGVWLIILCFLVGMLNFALLANAIYSAKSDKTEITEISFSEKHQK